jgi:hypothetical protein
MFAQTSDLMDHTLLVFALAFLVLCVSARIGASFFRRRRSLEQDVREDFGNILITTLTLSGLIIGFSFSMAVTRYDLRKGREAEEANAIGTEYVRADLLPAADAVKVHALLRDYLEQRVAFYTVDDDRDLRKINVRTAQLQAELWGAVTAPAIAPPSPLVALAVAGMNDVINSQGYSQAAWWNRIPTAAWLLMVTIGFIGNLLVGYTAEHIRARDVLLTVLPLVFSVSWLLIAEIDSPRSGLIRVSAPDLQHLVESLPAH